MTELLQPVSIIVVNHNAGELLLECVSVALQQGEEVIVVDNHSTDGSMRRLASAFSSQPRLKLVHSDKNFGFAAGSQT